MKDNNNEKLTIDLRSKSSTELVEFLNALLSAKQDLHRQGVKVKVKKRFPNKLIPSPVCISKF